MSRVGRKPITVPGGVKVNVSGAEVCVEGPKGKLRFQADKRIKIKVADGRVTVERPTNTPEVRSLHGLTRARIGNMIAGVTEEFSKALEIEGVGFRAQLKGKILELYLGFSHPIEFPIPEGIKVEVQKQTAVLVKGIDKELVGEAAAEIRSFYPPEPYKGKGVRYVGEHILRKQGKAAG